jgi:antitoxin component YwqK of YwqJK toxin-antitoxin module
MKENKSPKNKQGQRHGYWEIYFSNGQLYFRGNYIKDKEDGLWKENNVWIRRRGNYEQIKFYL